MLFIDIAEVVGKDDGVLLVVSSTQVKKFLRRRPKIRQVLEHAQIFDVRDHRNESGNTLDSILLTLRVLFKVDDVSRGLLRCDEAAQDNTLPLDVFPEELDVGTLVLRRLQAVVKPSRS